MVLTRKLRENWLRILTHIGALTPLALLAWDYWGGRLSVNPIQDITLRTGKAALVLLVLSLACTPINSVFGFRPVLRVRRPLGLYAFMYVGLHLLIFIGLDYGFDLVLIREAILEKRYALVGFAAFLLLLPLAVTSTKGWMRRLGRLWKRLHQAIYVISLLAVVHFVWLVKSDIREPLLFGAIVVLLLVLRIPRIRRSVSHVRSWFKGNVSQKTSSLAKLTLSKWSKYDILKSHSSLQRRGHPRPD
jgi:sulfoxide reductase heme-binding subunit YedZ